MIGKIDLASASKNKRSPRWVRLVAKHTGWKIAYIETVTTRQIADKLNDLPYGNLRKTIFLVNKGKFRGINKLVTINGLFLSTPSIRNVYSLRHAN